MDTTGGQKNKVKIDLEYLWEKYGTKKKHKPKPEVEEPKYNHEGFSVKFKLSHAYKALEKQEQDVAEPALETKKLLTPKMIKHLASKYKTTTPPHSEEDTHNIINRGSLQERVQTDLTKYREKGKLKREKSDMLLKIASEKEKEIPPSIRTKRTNAQCKSAKYWTSLSLRKGTEKDDTLSQDSDYEDRTFLTNANLSGMLKTSKGANTKQKKVKIKLDMPQSPRLTKSSHANKGKVQATENKENDKHKLFIGTKAILEWDRRRKQRHDKKLDQKVKIKEAANLNSPHQSHNTSQHHSHAKKENQAVTNTPRRKSTKHKKRPKSAPSPGRNGDTSENMPISFYKTLQSKQVSKWSKCLDAMYLDVPSNFEEPDIDNKKPEKDGTKSNDSDEDDTKSQEENEQAPPLLYKPSDYLYGMCNCQNIAKQTTLHKLQKKSKPAGVIQIFGCPGENEKSSTSCPFCSIFPARRIQAWLDDVETHTDPFWDAIKRMK